MRCFKLSCLFIVALLLIGFCFSANAQLSVYKDGAVTLAAGVTNDSDSAVLANSGVGRAQVNMLDRFVLNHSEGSGTGIVYVVADDIGVETPILTFNNVIPGFTTNVFVRRNTTTSWAGYNVTGDVQVATTATTTEEERYVIRALKIKVYQSTNGTAGASSKYEWAALAVP